MEVNREPTRDRALGHAPDQAELDAIVTSIVKTVDPERIILFGSGARGTMNDESDLDILVVKDRCRPRGTTTKILDAAPWGRWPLHVVVVWPEDLVRYRSSPWHVIPKILRDGRTLYAKAADGSPRRRGRTRVAATDSRQRRRPARQTRRTKRAVDWRRAVPNMRSRPYSLQDAPAGATHTTSKGC